MDVSPAQASDQIGKGGNPTGTAWEETCELGSKAEGNEPSQQQQYVSPKSIIDGPANNSDSVSNCVVTEQSEPPPVDIIDSSTSKHMESLDRFVVNNSSCKELGSRPEIVSKNPVVAHMGVHAVGEAGKSDVKTLVSPLEDASKVPLYECRELPTSAVPESLINEESGSATEEATKTSNIGDLVTHPQDDARNSGADLRELTLEYAAKNLTVEEFKPPLENATKKSALEQSDPSGGYEQKNVGGSVHKAKRTYNKVSKRLRSVGSTDRVLRSREKPKASEQNANVVNDSAAREKKMRKKKKQKKEHIPDEFVRVRNHLRYILNKIGYEQSLIDAYAGEGWKGLSVEKLRPEKELQRATSEIFRCKLRIRDLFQRLDSLCAEGRFPESLFDSDGLISSEDIYCAKCGSKDLSPNNDIILCDGPCDRGFHQFCLKPPLLTEEIPADDEGWLCPGCHCKDDCIGLLNESQGTNLSINDSWEKVYPEAAAAAAAGGNVRDENSGYLSDDSEDDDYDPDNIDGNENMDGGENIEGDEKVEGHESSSDESDFTSTSEEYEAPSKQDQLLGIPSDDSEDDDYDPDASGRSDQVKQGSSSSDFTSDSEGIGNELNSIRSSGKDEGSASPWLADELATDIADSAPVSAKRNLEKLDYKKLYDETYKNESSDSSDDEDWTDIEPPMKRKTRTGKVAPVSQSENSPTSNNGKIADGEEQKRASGHGKTRQKLNSERLTDLPSGSHRYSSEPGSTRKRGRPNRLGEAVTQRLYKAFKENQYPERSVKENIAKELGLTYQKVEKWFGNARWSWRHSCHEATVTKSVPDKKMPSKASKGQPDPMEEMNDKDIASNGVKITESPEAKGDKSGSHAATQVSSGQKSTTPNTRKRERKSVLDSEAKLKSAAGTSRRRKSMTPESLADTSGQKSTTPNSERRTGKSVLNTEATSKIPADTPKPQSRQPRGRYQTRSGKSRS